MRTIAIVGSGFSGSLTAVHLLRAIAHGAPLRIVLIERRGDFGPGLTYSTPNPIHLLNVPAGRMSALPDEPDHFLNWVRRRDPLATGGYFAPRGLYGQYIRDLLDQHASQTKNGAFERVTDTCEAIESAPGQQAQLRLASGRVIHADDVVLAIGNFPPSRPGGWPASCEQSPRYLANPWASTATSLDSIPPHDAVLLIGTGLTMVDVALALAQRGDGQARTGVIHALSRRGLLPQPHRSPPKPAKYVPPTGIDTWPRTAQGLLRAVRREVESAYKRHVDWREVITSLRHETATLWGNLPIVEKERFLRHVRAFWEVHRHRSAPQADGRIQEMILAGRLVIHTGRIERASADPQGFEVHVRPRGETVSKLIRVPWVINCTGPETDFTRINDGLIADLRTKGLIRPDPLGQGLCIGPHGEIEPADAHQARRPWLWGVGPLTKSRYWESTAVPELREQAQAMARTLVSRATASAPA